MSKEKLRDKIRCGWACEHDLLIRYHDEEWGIPVHDDQKHFEMLTLEGAQAGLNWLTILKKRENYRRLFKGFDPQKVAMMHDKELDNCLNDQGVIRNRLKIYSVRKNAVAFLEIQAAFGSFDKYIRGFVAQARSAPHLVITEPVTQTKESMDISKDLKKRGMTFVGPTIIYAYMQAVGLVNGHIRNCWQYKHK